MEDQKEGLMALQFRVPQSVVEEVVSILKKSHLVHPDAVYNGLADQGFRKEVAYRDIDLLDRIGWKEFEEENVDAALIFLKEKGLVDPDAAYDKKACSDFRGYLEKTLVRKSWTTLSTTMQRLIFMLTSVKKPKDMIELGCFWGFTLAWFAGPCLGPDPVHRPRRIIGIDIDKEPFSMAEDNFRNIRHDGLVRLYNEDARQTLDRLEGSFDFVYIESKTDDDDDMYLQILKKIYDKIPVGGWVIAHDATRYTQQEYHRNYLSFVRDKAHFRESILFDVDAYGLELSVK
jgi:predicted O-methyltransferase YrrM